MDILVFLVFIIVTLYLYEKYKLKFKIEFRFVFIILLLCLFVYDPSLIKDFITMFYDKNTTHPSKISTKLNRKSTKRAVSESIKKMVAANQQWKCSQCGMILSASYEIDHIKPLYMGGSNEIGNLTAMCRNCHGNKTLSDKLFYR